MVGVIAFAIAVMPACIAAAFAWQSLQQLCDSWPRRSTKRELAGVVEIHLRLRSRVRDVDVVACEERRLRYRRVFLVATHAVLAQIRVVHILLEQTPNPSGSSCLRRDREGAVR